MKKWYLYLSILLSISIMNSCHKREDNISIDYDTYTRIAGPEGGQLMFFRNYSNDNNTLDTLIKINIPEGALDTTVIINVYMYFNEILYGELYDEFNLLEESNFFYIVPFYSFSSAVDSVTAYKLDKHLSIDFNYPILFTYFIDTTRYYDPQAYYKLYRIKTPRYNEWSSENIWMEFNKQGYPNGYNNLDLYYLINGKWISSGGYGSSPYSMANWELVSNYSVDSQGHSVSFEMDKTDYIYVLVDDSKKN